MAITNTPVGNGGALSVLSHFAMLGDRIGLLFGKIDLDNSYPTGGEVLDLSNYFETIKQVHLTVAGDLKADYVFGAGDSAALGKVLLRTMNTGAEVANGSDQSAVDVYYMAIGVIGGA